MNKILQFGKFKPRGDKNMLEALKTHRKTLIITLTIFLLSMFSIVQYVRAKSLTRAMEIEYNRVFTELTEYVDDLQISLLKGQVVSTPGQMAKLSADLYSQASAAKANLSLLPMDGKQLEKTSEFLSQVGEYATCLSEKMLRGEALSDKEIKTMQELTTYANKLRQGFDKMLLDINEGRMTFSQERKYLPSVLGGGKTQMASELMMLEEEFHNYPSLIYDGPFSQHLTLKKPVFISGKPEISENQAIRRAEKFTGTKDVGVVKIDGKLPSYSISGNGITAEFTKNGGVLLMLVKDRHIGEETLSVDDAKIKAEIFLRDNGYENMKESYYEKRDGSVVINYAYYQDDYIVFPDLVKVKIALDDGEILGFESRGYVTNHTYRTIPEPKITKEQALGNVNKNLEITGVSMAIIPLESGNEACCWQIKGKVSDKHFLMYVNTQTGYTEDVQILLESESGTLAV